MSKGNLYTTIIRKNDPRIYILSELKSLWRNKPVDFKKVRKLQIELHNIDKDKKIKTEYKTIFGQSYFK